MDIEITNIKFLKEESICEFVVDFDLRVNSAMTLHGDYAVSKHFIDKYDLNNIENFKKDCLNYIETMISDTFKYLEPKK